MPFDPNDIRLPRISRLFLEPLGVTELVNLLPARHFIEALPAGDGRPVMVIPGLTTNDLSTKIIRTFLRSKGFYAYGWGLGVNIRYSLGLERKLVERIDRISQKHGRKVSLIGWSLGGITMRILARHHPEQISQLIALGAPFADVRGKTHVNWWYELVTGERVSDFNPEWAIDMASRPLMPSTSIYSKKDGMVSWQYCMDWETGPATQNIEVYCNHLGFGMNPVVWMIVHDRLMQEENEWKPFDISRIKEIEDMRLFHI